MKRLPFLLGMLLLSLGVMAQQSLLVFLEASEKKPFYVKIGTKTNASSASGQVYITELTGTNFDIFIGFPETDLPEYRFPIALKKSDNSFQLKQASQGWTLIDLETNKVIQPGTNVVSTSIPMGGVRKTDAFSVMMAGVVNDTSVLYTSVISVPEEPKKEVPVASTAAADRPGEPAVATGDPGTKRPGATETAGREKLHSATQVDSTRVKHVDSSLAFQKPPAATQEAADSLKRAAEVVASNGSTQKDLPQIVGKEVAAGEPGAIKTGDSVEIKKAEINAAAERAKDSLDKVALVNAQAAKDSIAKDIAGKEAVASQLTRDSLAKDAVAKDAIAKDAAEKDVAAKDAAAKDAAAKDAAAKDAAAKDAAAKDAAAKDAAAKDAAAKDAAVKDAAAKDSIAKAALAAENAKKTTNTGIESGRKDNADNSGIAASAAVVKISEKKEGRELVVLYTVKEAGGKADTVRILIPVDSPSVSAPKSDSVFPRWQSNPRPLTDPVVKKKDSVPPSGAVPANGAASNSATNAGQGSSANQGTGSANGAVTGAVSPPAKGPVMINSDCVNFATEYDLDKLRVKMVAEVSADDRIAAAKKIFRTKCFTTRQVRALTELFLNDEGKYKFLDTAYPFVSDSQEFRNLVSVLKEDYYIKRFNAMIRL